MYVITVYNDVGAMLFSAYTTEWKRALLLQLRARMTMPSTEGYVHHFEFQGGA